MTKLYSLYGGVNFNILFDNLEKISAQDVSNLVSQLVATKPTLTVTGDAINLVKSVSDVSK